MTSDASAIETEGLGKAYHGLGVLHHISLRVRESECVALAGPNGSGKTTLLKCLAGAIRPTAGTVTWYGRAAGRSLAVRRWIGWLAHEPHLYSHLTVRENLIFAARMNDMKKPADRADSLLKSAGLQVCADSFPPGLSRGLRQRLAVTQAIVHEPRIVLLDEPFAALDQPSRDWLCDLISDLVRRQRAVCFTSHDASTWRLASRVLRLQDGSLEEIDEQAHLTSEAA